MRGMDKADGASSGLSAGSLTLDAGAGTRRALDLQGAAMQPDETAHHREPEPRAFIGTIVGGFRLEERVSQPRKIARRDADPRVVDRKLDERAHAATVALSRVPLSA